mmetsp:Transcript_32010/g.41150  ORF Transcript_32010/g.41150 Transcript_32010/m.41150 type:complete len:218 (+) Transcript_32010:104-757(+)
MQTYPVTPPSLLYWQKNSPPPSNGYNYRQTGHYHHHHHQFVDEIDSSLDFIIANSCQDNNQEQQYKSKFSNPLVIEHMNDKKVITVPSRVDSSNNKAVSNYNNKNNEKDSSSSLLVRKKKSHSQFSFLRDDSISQLFSKSFLDKYIPLNGKKVSDEIQAAGNPSNSRESSGYIISSMRISPCRSSRRLKVDSSKGYRRNVRRDIRIHASDYNIDVSN